MDNAYNTICVVPHTMGSIAIGCVALLESRVSHYILVGNSLWKLSSYAKNRTLVNGNPRIRSKLISFIERLQCCLASENARRVGSAALPCGMVQCKYHVLSIKWFLYADGLITGLKMWKLMHGHIRVIAVQKLFALQVRCLGGFSALAPRSLDSILKLNTVVHASPEEVVSLWNKYHSGRGLVSAVMKVEQFNTLQHRAKTCPLFVIPLQQKDGYTSFFLQAQMPHLLLTGLEDYKVRGTNASPYLTVAHYTELADSKGLVLVRGDIVFPSKLSDVEAKKLLDVSHSFFLHDNRFRLVKQFNKDSQDFEFQDVLKELNLPLGP